MLWISVDVTNAIRLTSQSYRGRHALPIFAVFISCSYLFAMPSVNPYLELLKEELLDKCCTINPTINKLRKLQHADFKTIASILDQTLDANEDIPFAVKRDKGTTLSVSTLERIFKYGYLPNKRDKRVTRTLDILSLFIDYSDWDSFVQEKNTSFKQGNSIEGMLVDIVTKANQAEFEAYRKLPKIETAELLKYRTESGSGYLRIYNVLVQHSKKGWTIGNEGNPSGFTQQKVWIESMSNDKAVVKSQEYWYLRWFEIPTQLYRYIYNEENEQTKTLELIDGEWKVSSVFYPSPRNSVHITHVVFAYLPKSIQKFAQALIMKLTSK